MTMGAYIAEYNLKHIYKDETFETWVSKKCPSCNGGFAGRVSTIKKNAGVPTTFYDKRLDAFDWSLYRKDDGTPYDTSKHQETVTKITKEFEKWDERGMGLYIWSKVKGSGKSFLASCICNELMNTKAIKTRFVNCADLIDISQSGDKDSWEEYKRDPMKLLRECKFLVLDDIGQRTNSEWLEDLLYKLIDERTRNNLVTIITANMSISDLKLDDRISDRINAKCIPLHLPEVKIRSKETMTTRNEFLKEMGLIS